MTGETTPPGYSSPPTAGTSESLRASFPASSCLNGAFNRGARMCQTNNGKGKTQRQQARPRRKRSRMMMLPCASLTGGQEKITYFDRKR
jgi:hypothetical protein